MKLLPALSLAALIALSAAGCAATPQTVADASTETETKTERTGADLPGVRYPGLICRAAPGGGERCMSRGQWVEYDREVSNNAQTAADRRGPQSGPTIDGW